MAEQKGNIPIGGYSALTHADISAFIGRTLTSAEQSLVTTIIAMAEYFFCKATNRNYLTTVDYIDTKTTEKTNIYLSNFPINEVKSITIDDVEVYVKGGSTNTMVLDEDFYVYDDHINFISLPMAFHDKRKFEIIYTIYTCFMPDAKLVLLEMVSNLFLAREEGGKEATSINAGGLSESFGSNVSDYAKQVINSYRKYNL